MWYDTLSNGNTGDRTMPHKDSTQKPSNTRLGYNLEKEPLQTGIKNSGDSMRLRALNRMGGWARNRSGAGWVILFLITAFLVFAMIFADSLIDSISNSPLIRGEY